MTRVSRPAASTCTCPRHEDPHAHAHERGTAPGILLLPLAVLLAASPPALAEPARQATDFGALRLSSLPLPGTHDERAVDEGPALEVFLSPSDFPDALVHIALTGDAAAFVVNLDATASRGEALPARVRWPALGGRGLRVRAPGAAIPLLPPPGGPRPSADDLEAEETAIELYLRPVEPEAEAELVGELRAVRLRSPRGRTLLEWAAAPEPSGCGEAEAGRPGCVVPGVPRVVRSLAVHPSGRWIAVAGGDLRPRVDVLDSRELRPLWRVAFPPWLGPPVEATFTPDGRHLVFGDGSGAVHLLEAETGGGHRRIASRARSFALLDAGRLVAVSDSDGGLTFWRVRDGTVDRRLGRQAHGPSPLLTPSGDGLRLAALDYAEGRATVVVWDVESGRVAGRLAAVGSGLVDLTLDAAGESVLATHDRDGLLRHRVGTAVGFEPWGGAPARGCRGALAWSPDRTRLACATSRGALVLAPDGAVEAELEAPPPAEAVSALAFGPEGETLIATGGGAVLSWQLRGSRGGGE